MAEELLERALERFIPGGRVEIDYPKASLYGGGDVLTINGDFLTISFLYLYEGLGKSTVKVWRRVNHVFAIELDHFSVSDIGPEPGGGKNRICLHSFASDPMIIIYLPPEVDAEKEAAIDGGVERIPETVSTTH